jgi:drug/metabolite transporter (DMT)-like permease
MPETTMADGHPTPARWLVIAAFAAIYVVWGSTYLAIRFAIETMPPFLMAGTRFLIAGLLLFGWARLRGADAPTGRQWGASAVLGALFLLLGNGGVVWAETRVPSGLTSLLVAMVPVWTVLVSWGAPGGQRPTAGVVAGLAAGFVGVGLLVAPGGVSAGGGVDPVGAAVLIAASLSWAVASVLSPRLRLPVSAPLASSLQMLSGGALLVLAGIVTGELGEVHAADLSVRSLLAFLYLIVFGSLIGFSAFAWLLRVTSPSRVATYAYVNPAVAVFLGWAFAGEALGGRTLVAAAVIVAAVVLITTARARAAAAPQGGRAGRLVAEQ